MPTIADILLFSEEESYQAVVKSLRTGKHREVVKIITIQNPCLLLGMYKAHLTARIFYSRWKIAHLVLNDKNKGGVIDLQTIYG